MRYKEFSPTAPLSPYIKCFWTLEHDYRHDFHRYEHLWADIHPELIFVTGNGYYRREKSNNEKLPSSFVIGAFEKNLQLYSDGLTALVAVRFEPWGLFPLSLSPMSSLTNHTLPANHVFGKNIHLLNRRLRNKSRRKRVDIVRDFFLQEFQSIEKKTLTVMGIAQRIIAKKGIVKISALAERFGIDQKQVARRFKRQVGLNPKMFAKIVRFNYAKRKIEKYPEIMLSEVAYQAGYSDQAHFSKNFRELFDLTPAQFKSKVASFLCEAKGTNIDVHFLQD